MDILETLPPYRLAVRCASEQAAGDVYRLTSAALQVAAEAEDTDVNVFRLRVVDDGWVVCYCGTQASDGLVGALAFFLGGGIPMELPPPMWMELNKRRKAALALHRLQMRRN